LLLKTKHCVWYVILDLDSWLCCQLTLTIGSYKQLTSLLTPDRLKRFLLCYVNRNLKTHHNSSLSQSLFSSNIIRTTANLPTSAVISWGPAPIWLFLRPRLTYWLLATCHYLSVWWPSAFLLTIVSVQVYLRFSNFCLTSHIVSDVPVSMHMDYTHELTSTKKIISQTCDTISCSVIPFSFPEIK
jgi:hypothetical protein